MTLSNLKSIALSILFLFPGIIRHDVPESAYLELGQQKQFECVGQIWHGDTPMGSCVLVQEKYVLTAAHVLITSDTRADTVVYNGQRMVTYTPINERVVGADEIRVQLNDQFFPVSALLLHPNYRDEAAAGSCDIAIMTLQKPVNGIMPAKISYQQDELNAKVVGVGYGASGIASKPETVGQFGKKIAGENVIDSIGGETYRNMPTVMYCDFDHPTISKHNKSGSPDALPLEYICSGGDSGGALFRNRNDAWELIGICSGSNVNVQQLIESGYYGQTMEWTRVSVFSEWLSDYMN